MTRVSSVMNVTLPSHMAAFTPPPPCRLRAAIIRARVVVEVSVHGGVGDVVVLQMPPVRTSC